MSRHINKISFQIYRLLPTFLSRVFHNSVMPLLQYINKCDKYNTSKHNAIDCKYSKMSSDL